MDDFDRLIQKVERLYPKLPRRVGGIVIEFSHQRFREQAWVDVRMVRWVRKSKLKNKGRGILIKTGRGRRSIRITKTTQTSVAVGSDVPYMAAHNEGVDMKKQVVVRSHSRKGKRKRMHQVRAHQRMMHIRIPQNKFLDESAVMNRNIERGIAADLIKTLR